MIHAADPGNVEQKPPAVAFVSMPFHRCTMPPIGLGILKSALSAVDLPSTIYNLNLDLLPELDETAEEALKLYEGISERFPSALVGEWLFARPEVDRDERYLDLLSSCGFGPDQLAVLRRLRSRVDDLVSHWAQRVAAGRHDIVGLSSSLGRTRANVMLAEAVRRLAPRTRILFGGLETSGDMGRALLEAFPVIDVVCHTEAEELIVPIVRALRGEPGYSLDALRGISYRRGDRLVTQMDGASPPDLERTPLPDYDDYFEHVNALRTSWDKDLDLPSYLPIETARGCWWGARQHCIFCSVNGDRIRYFSKSPGRVLTDLDALLAKHGVKRFLVVDNVLNNDYFRTLLPSLAELKKDYLLEWEVRPNLGRTKVAALSQAGVAWVQPGIESLSTPALRTMNKGTTAIDNIQAMKWLMAYQIKCTWNFLFSLPGEKLEWYDDVARVLPRLMHLDPPRGPHRIGVERFSPYFSQAQGMGIELLGPTAFARMAFDDVSDDLLERLVYDFDYEIRNRPPDLDARIRGILEPHLARWRESFEARGCTLSLVDGPDESLLVEGPLLEPDRILRVRGLLRRFLEGCETIQSERVLLERLAADGQAAEDFEPPLGPRAYGKLLDELCFTGIRPEEGPAVTLSDVVAVADERGWIYRESGRILSLPVDQTRYVKSGPFKLEAAYRRYR
jgi:ribosomal peptide maturation radical SAM protein 1